eukprot:6529487-Alexandrium_andersonii.AAC.1
MRTPRAALNLRRPTLKGGRLTSCLDSGLVRAPRAAKPRYLSAEVKAVPPLRAVWIVASATA